MRGNSFRFQLRRASAAELTARDEILRPGEMCWESDTDQLKIGDGVTSWISLPYFGVGFQPLDADLTWVAANLTTAGRNLLDDADAAAQRATLGLGTLATQSGTFSGTSSGTNTGDQTTVSGNAGTATALQNARTINGVSFNGTANISVPPPVDQKTRIFRSPLGVPAASAIIVSGTVYFTYLGYFANSVVIKFVEAILAAAGTVSQACEVGLFTSPAAPNKTNQTLTCVAADGTVDTLIGGSVPRVVRNTTAFSSGAGYTVPAGTHLWSGIRIAMGGSQPQMRWLGQDHGHGFNLVLAGQSALAVSSTYAATIPATVTGNSAVDTCATLD